MQKSHNVTVKNNTIILLVGPTGCGKTYFTTNFLKPGLENYGAKVKTLSVDNFREDICGHKINNRQSKDFYETSEGAYIMLRQCTELYTSYPTNKFADVVIVDSSGMDKELHKDMKKIAEKNNYNLLILLFDFKKLEQFLEHSSNKELTRRQLETYRKEIVPFVKKMDRVDVIYLSHLFEDYEIIWKNTTESIKINDDEVVHIFSSALGDVATFDKLEENIDSNNVVIFMGNYIGSNPEIIRRLSSFLTKHPTSCVLKGHMEYNVYTKLSEGQKSDIFNNYEQNDIETFKRIYENSYVYIKYGKYEITTSLCERSKIKKLQKNNNDSEEKFRELMKVKSYFVQVCSFPLVTERVCEGSVCLIGEKHNILTLNNHKKKHNITNIEPDIMYKTFLTLTTTKTNIQLIDYDVKLFDLFTQKRIANLSKKSVNYISGTISPSDKRNGELETIGTALWYFHTMYENKGLLSIQVKDMGSRFQFYYFRQNKEKSYGVSRNGYVTGLSKETLCKIYDELTPKLQKFYFFEESNLIIVDGELMPWSALGKSLIDMSFVQPYESAESEIELLEEYGFTEQQDKLLQEYESSQFDKDSNDMKKQELYKKHITKYETYSSIQENRTRYIDLETKKKGIKIFGEQIGIFGKKCELNEIYFKPFCVLKVCVDNDEQTEFLPNECLIGNVEMYEKLSDNKTLTIDLSNPMKDNLEKVIKFNEDVIVAGQFEGLIFKPDFVDENIAPCLKVRNSNYLHIIYGPDYLTERKYEELLRKKNIKDKLASSIKEYKLGQMMLKIKYNEINQDNLEMIRLYANFIQEEENEKTFDRAL